MGADYRPAPKSAIYGAPEAQLNLNVTRFYAMPGSIGHVNVGRAECFVPTNGVLRNLMVHAHNPPGAGETYTFTLMLNGNATILEAVIAGAVDMEAFDLVNAVAIAQGDNICMRAISSLNSAVSFVTWGLELTT